MGCGCRETSLDRDKESEGSGSLQGLLFSLAGASLTADIRVLWWPGACIFPLLGLCLVNLEWKALGSLICCMQAILLCVSDCVAAANHCPASLLVDPNSVSTWSRCVWGWIQNPF